MLQLTFMRGVIAWFAHQAPTLHYAETVLFVDDDESQFGKLYFFFDQRVSADYQLSVSLRDMPASRSLALFLQRTSQENHAISMLLEQFARA